MKKKILLLFCCLLICFNQKQLISQSADSVVQAWVQIYNGPASSYDYASDIAVDQDGNVYVTGWSSDFPVYPNDYDLDYVTIKYNTDGVMQWLQRYKGLGLGDDDRATAIAIDGQGNVYVTGMSQGTFLDYEYATIKYNSTGAQQWVQRYSGTYHNRARAITVDVQGNVYVTGRSWGPGSEDYATIKYNTNGVQQWLARYNGPSNAHDYASDIAVDASGNVYVTGQSIGSGTEWDYATVKYNSDGIQQWAARYNGPGNEFDVARKISADNSGNVYVTGYSVGSGSGRDYLTIKYNTNGEEQWVRRYNGPANGTDEANDIVIDDSGNVYVTGFSVGAVGIGTNYDYATIKYNSEGDLQWVARYSGPNNWDVARAISIDNAGNIFVTGYSFGSGTQQDYLTIAYDNNGTELWQARYNGLGNNDDLATSIATDVVGNVYVTGRTTGIGTGDDYTTIKYGDNIIPVELISFSVSVSDNSVKLNWATTTEINNYGFEVHRKKSAEKNQRSYWETITFVPGYGTTTEPRSYTYNDSEAQTGKYTYRLKQIDFDGSYEYSQEVEVEVTLSLGFALEQNYPNPFNSNTTIEYSLETMGRVYITVFNLLGQNVAEILNEFKVKGNYQVVFDASSLASGIYFYQMRVGNFSQVKKMILLR